ncbi:unnamed protein product [Gulo gulo]|uniref:Uncharacterized protein n=1 Tax=Gulo gulo TaxID=48420 RepID=A0A9X9Q8S5_GULGU|nr:unnamed protein product [Gulo gulo]
MQVTTGHYRQSEPSCFDLVNMGFVMGYAVDMVGGRGTLQCRFLSQDPNVGLGADGWPWENHDADWQPLWPTPGLQSGHPLLISMVVTLNTYPFPSVPAHVLYNKTSLHSVVELGTVNLRAVSSSPFWM